MNNTQSNVQHPPRTHAQHHPAAPPPLQYSERDPLLRNLRHRITPPPPILASKSPTGPPLPLPAFAMSNGGIPAGRVPDTGSGRKHRLNAAMNSLNKSMSLRSDGDGPEEGSGGVRSEADGGRGNPLLMNDVRSVRRAALTVMSPLVYTWVRSARGAEWFLPSRHQES